MATQNTGVNQSTKTGLVSTFAGSDVTVIFGDEYIGECMSFTVGTNREKGPLFIMGHKDAIAFPAGKRGCGGSFVLAQLGYDALLQYVSTIFKNDTYRKATVRKSEIIPQMVPNGFEAEIKGGTGTFQQDPNVTTGGSNTIWEAVDPFYVDQLPPFNVTIIGVNEQGDKMGFRVYGMVIMNEGIAISIDELNMEKRYTFMAKGVSKMMKLT
jgi:hypothetical protein